MKEKNHRSALVYLRSFTFLFCMKCRHSMAFFLSVTLYAILRSVARALWSMILCSAVFFSSALKQSSFNSAASTRTLGSENGHIRNPTGVTLDNRLHLYVADQFKESVQIRSFLVIRHDLYWFYRIDFHLRKQAT